MTGDESWPLKEKKYWPRGNESMGKTDHSKKKAKKACLPPVKATTLEMLARNITRGAYAPYVGNPDLYCGLSCDPCDASVGVSERVLDSMYERAKKLYKDLGLATEVAVDDATRNQLLEDVRKHMKKYHPEEAGV